MTHRPLTLILAVLFACGVLGDAAAAPARDRYGCADLAAYQQALLAAVDPDDLERLVSLMDRDIETLRPSQLLTIARITDEWATALEEMRPASIPRAARPYHEAFGTYLGLLSSITTAMASQGIMGALPYADAIDVVLADLEEANAYGARTCPAEWPFGDDPGGEV